MAYLELENICKTFTVGKHKVEVLRGVSFAAETGEWIALLGASGSGKTTLLDIAGTLSRPDSGTVRFAGQDIARLSSRALTAFRRKNIGFVFQAYHLLPELTILENVMLPALLDGQSAASAGIRAQELLERTGLKNRIQHRPNELSGGEQQRAAIARAVMLKPAILFADEPTGNLDSVTGRAILDLFTEIHQSSGTTIVMVTHDPGVAALAMKRIRLSDGLITDTNEPTEK